MKTKKLIAILALAIAASAWADTWTDPDTGYTWTYRINGDTAEIYGNYDGSTYTPAISPSPTGIVTIPSTFGGKPVTSIGNYAFYGCSGLTSVTIPDSVTSIGYSAFYGCSGLTSVTIPGGVTSIGYAAFASCSGLTSVTIPGGVTSIGYAAFASCSGLTSVMIPDGVMSIGDQAFLGCSGLTSITIPDSVISIGNNAFEECRGLTSVSIPRNVTSIEERVFAYCYGLTSVMIPDSVTNIGIAAFYSCSGLKSATIPDSVTSIGGLAFQYCSSLTSVTMTDSVTSIGGQAFYGCSGLTSVTIPSGVTSIGEWAFYDCSGLTNITMCGDAPSVGRSAFFNVTSDCVVRIPRGNETYTVADGKWQGMTVEYYDEDAQPEFTIVAGVLTDVNLNGATDIVIPDGVTSIGHHAFYYCSDLVRVMIPDSVTSIGDCAFAGCTKMTAFAVADGNQYFKTIDGILCSKDGATLVCVPSGIEGAFSIPDGVTRIVDYALEGCSGLTSVTIPDSVTSIGDGISSGCIRLTAFVVSEGNQNYKSNSGLLLTKDGTTLVAGVNGTDTIPDGVTSIGSGAFFEYSGLTSVTIPGSVTNISFEAFCGCSELVSVTMRGDAPSVEWYAFDDVASDCVVRIPRGNSTYAVTDGKWQGMTVEYYDEKLLQHTVVFELGECGIYTGGGELVQSVTNGCAAVAPEVTAINGWEFVGWSSDFSCVTNDLTVIAQYVPLAEWSGVETIDGITWKFKIANGIATITGTEETSSVTDLNIPNSVAGVPVVGIAYGAFDSRDDIQTVRIPSNVRTIDLGAFMWSGNIKTVIIESEFLTTGDFAFGGCDSLRDVYFYGNLPSFGPQTFPHSDVVLHVRNGTFGWQGSINGMTVKFEDFDDAPEHLHDSITYFVSQSGSDANTGLGEACAFKTIQRAVDASRDGDNIIVCPGTYESFCCTNKFLRIIGRDGQEQTIIDGGYTNRCVTFDIGYQPQLYYSMSWGASKAWAINGGSVLSGFTLINGTTYDTETYGYEAGGGCVQGGTISNCVLRSGYSGWGGAANASTLIGCEISQCSSRNGGGAYQCYLDRCVVRGNWSSDYGGGVTWSRLDNCLVSDNSSPYVGGGAYNAILRNCTVVGNRVTYGQGAGLCDCDAINTIVWANYGQDGLMLDNWHLHNEAYVLMENTCTLPRANGRNNIDADPLLVRMSNGDYRLGANSPCIDAGCNQDFISNVDCTGNSRLQGGAIDIGAYEGCADGVIVRTSVAEGFGTITESFAGDIGETVTITANFGNGGITTERSFLGFYVDGIRVDDAQVSDVWHGKQICLTLEKDAYEVEARFESRQFHVSPTGSDDLDGRSWATAKKTIQSAVDCAYTGDSIVVTNGIYAPFRVRKGYAFAIESVNGPEVTVIDGGQSNRCVTIDSTSPLTIVAGFTLQNGKANQDDGGGLCNGAAVNCIFQNNQAGQGGGGAYGARLENCIVTGNKASYYGGGLSHCSANRCRVEGNSSQSVGGALYACTVNDSLILNNVSDTGGGAYHSKLINCTVVGNSASSGAGVSGWYGWYGEEGDACTCINSIIWDNYSGEYLDNGWGTFRNCTVNSAWDYTASTESPFVYAANGDYHLSINSSCINAGDNSYVSSVTDFSGNPRIVDDVVDIGAYEYQGQDLPDIVVHDVVASHTALMPGDMVTVQYVEVNVGTRNVVEQWIDRVMLEGADGSRVNLKTLSVTNGLDVGQVVTNEVQCIIPDLVALAGDVRFVVVVDANDDVAETGETNNECKSEVVSLGQALYLVSASESVKENISSGVRFTVRRSGPVGEALTVAIGNTDMASAAAPATVTIPAGSVSTIFTVTPIDNDIVDGARMVNVSVSAEGFTGAVVSLTIIDDEVPRLTVTLDKASIREGDGVITATVFREGSTDGDLTVYLAGTSGSRASYPSSVVIPSGASFVTFEISVPNNDTAQVASELTLRASSSGYQSAAVTYTVEDDDVPGVVLTIAPEAVQEGAGASAAVMTLARVDTEDMSKAITVRLTASAANVLIMPKEVVIPANNPYVRQEIGIIDNTNVEPDCDITITGAIVIPSCNCSAQPSSGGEIQTMLRIIDDDSLALKLRVEPLMMKEGQEVAGYITIGQNTVLSENLVVSLYSDNDAEVELPPTVVIPAGETSVRIPVKTLNDGVEDGTVQVNIYAEADGYAPDSKWVFVTDQNLPDLMPVDVMPQYATTTSGERFPVHLAVTNIGYLTSKRSVPFSIYCVKGKSAAVEGAGMLVFSGMTAGAVDIGESETVSAIVTVPEMTGDCRFAVVVDPDRLITELNDANNTAYSSVVSVSPSYMAEAQVECERFLQGSTIEINGVAVKADGTTPAANVEVEVYIIRDEFRRSLTATTDAQGRFAAIFKPTTSEAGHYVVGASFPGMNATAEQDAFDILGMKRTSEAYLEYNNIPLGDVMSKTVYIRNMSPIDLTGISAEVVGVLSGCEIETSFADVLSGGATTPLTLTLRGTDLTSGRDYKEFTLRLTSAEGATLDIPVLYFVQYQQAHLKASPASINTTMTVGQTRYVDFTIYNDGRGDSGKVTILTSPFSWLSVEGGNEISNIASNESAIVTLKLTPGDDVELNNRYTGEIALVCESRHGKVCVVPFAFKAVSEHTGTVKVDVIDGYTYYLESAPHVSNATVRISNIYTGEIVASGRTGSDGTWVSGEIGEGKWQLTITADRHKSHYDVITVSPGMETSLPPIYLEAQSVSISYNVTPTNIVDTYVVTLVTEYETAVPEPVLVTTFDGRIPNLQEGDQFAFNAIVVNKGLVAVHGVYLEMPTIDGWEFTVGDSRFSLAPEESAVVPIIVSRPRKRMSLMATTAAVTVTKVDCVDVVRTRGYWYCGSDRRWHEYKGQLPTERVCTTTTYTIVPDEDDPKPPYKPGRTGGGGGTYAPGGGGSGTSRITISKTDCDPVMTERRKILGAITDARKGAGKACWDDLVDGAMAVANPVLDSIANMPVAVFLKKSGCASEVDFDGPEATSEQDFALRPLAEVMKDVYRDPNDHVQLSMSGFRRLDKAETLNVLGGVFEGNSFQGFSIDSEGLIKDPTTGFKAAFYVSSAALSAHEGELVLAFAGTEREPGDIKADIENYACNKTEQYDSAERLAKIVAVGVPSSRKIIIVGHSLGGGLAQYAMLKSGLGSRASVTTYNSAGLCGTKLVGTVDDCAIAAANVTNFRASNDPVSVLGFQLGSTYQIKGTSGHSIYGAGITRPEFTLKDYSANWIAASAAKVLGNNLKIKLLAGLFTGGAKIGDCVTNIQIALTDFFKSASGGDVEVALSAYKNLSNGVVPNIGAIQDASAESELVKRLALASFILPAAQDVRSGIWGASATAADVISSSLDGQTTISDSTTLGDEWLSISSDDQNDFIRSLVAMSLEVDSPSFSDFRNIAPSSISDEALAFFIERLQYTVECLSNGNQSASMFDFTRISIATRVLSTIENYAIDCGFASISEMLDDAIEKLSVFYDKSSASVCAKVTLELSQEVTMTREAFLGTLSVSNGHTSKPITDMKMEVEITDENGDRCENLFQPDNAGLVTMQGVSILDGGVSLAANSSGSANILFTPSTKAAQTVPKVYYFGGTVTYTDPFVGETVKVKLQPAVPVTVHPSPELTFHYFLQRDVIGDDPFTKDVVEESEPAEVALVILNNGYGDAENVTIKTAEPTITENEKELKVDFNWVEAALDGSSTRLGYRNVDIGTVPAQGSRLAQWWLTSSLQGHFTKVDGSYTRLNSNGNPDFDLIKDVRTHMLVRSITADSDALPDFLVTERRFDGKPDKIYTAKGETMDVTVASGATFSGNSGMATLTVIPGATGWNYASSTHSFGDGLTISRVTRSDGSEVPLRNVWLTKRTFEDGVDPIVENRIHVADEMVYGSSASYTVTFGASDGVADRLQVVGFTGVADQMSGNPAAIEVQFSHDIDAQTFDVADLTLHHQGTSVSDLSRLTIAAGSGSGTFRISGFDNLGLGSGTYVLTVLASGVNGIDGVAGIGGKSVMWTVVGDTTPPEQIADLAISPDGGFSDMDGITYTGALTVTGTLPEDGLTVEIIAKYVSGGETVLMTMPSAGEGSLPAGAFSQNINLPGSGNVTLVVRLTDVAGNSSNTEKNVYVDGIALTGTLTGASDDEGVITSSATLTLSDRAMDGDVALEKFLLTRDGEVVALEGVTLRRVGDNAPYQWELSGLDSLCAEDGVYVLTFNGAAVRKYTSGLPMSGSPLMMTWRYANPDREPPMVSVVLFDGETPHEAYTNDYMFSAVSVTFGEAVNVPELIENGLIEKAARIDLLDAAGVVTGSAAVASTMTWNGESNTLSWQIDPLSVPAGRTRLMLDAGLIKDLAGNHLAAEGYAATNGLRAYTLSETVLTQINAQAMPTWYNGELYVGEKTADNKGKIRHYAANGTWAYLQYDGVDIEIPAQGCQGASVAFADMDGNGAAEIYVGTATGDVLKYPGGETVASLGANRAMPYACDIDGDGRDELIAGGMDGRIRLISRDTDAGTYSVVLVSDVNGSALTVPNGRAAPVVADINHDGIADIVSGDTAGDIWAYLGDGNAWCAQPLTVFTNNVSLADRSRLGYGDVDGDGIEDLIVGRSDGSVTVMLGAEMPSPIVPFAVKVVVSALAGAHGSIAPVGDTTYDGGDTPEYVITPDIGYHVADVLVDDVSIGATNNYVFAPLTTSHTISVDFAVTPYAIIYTGLRGAENQNPVFYTVEDAIEFAAPGDVYGWMFTGWEPASIALGSAGDVEVAAQWERQKFNVTVDGETTQYSYEDMATLATADIVLAGAAKYVCKGWTATNSDPVVGDGATAQFKVLGDVSFNWLWETNVVTFAQAVNAEELDWTLGGAVEWQPEWAADASDGIHHAKCGAIPNGTNAWSKTTVEGAGTIAFKWCSSLTSDNTRYQFMVDGEVKGMLTGTNDWDEVSVAVFGERTHEIKWRLITGRSGASEEDWVAFDEVVWTQAVPPTIAEALNTRLAWTTDGDVAWRAVARETLADSRDAWAAVVGLGDNGHAYVQTRVHGSGVLVFDWAVSCEEDYDGVKLSVDGNVRNYISGDIVWTSAAVEIVGDGWHVVRWEYIKDELDDLDLAGENTAKLDNVIWRPDNVEPIPPLVEDASIDLVNLTVNDIGFADANVKNAIGGNALEYVAFKTWAGSVKGVGSASGTGLAGEAAVVANANAAAAFMLGAERLFENAPKVEISEVEIGNVASGTSGTPEAENHGTMTVAVAVKDGDQTVAVDAEKVAAMFEATGDLGDWTGAAKLTPEVVIEDGDGMTMRFKVTPGDGTAPRAFLRIRK